jgi:hypothetical protein
MKIPILMVAVLIVIVQSSMATDSSAPFVDVSEAAGISAPHRAIWYPDKVKEGYLAMGQAWGDYDNDGWPDLYVTGNLEPNVLYHNNGDGTFDVSALSESVSVPDIPSGGAVWADYDNDGWADLYVLNAGENRLFHNEAATSFVEVGAAAGVNDSAKGTTAAWGDYDRDGWLDLYVTNWSCFPECDPIDVSLQQDRLYRNNRDGTFEDVTSYLDRKKTLGAGFSVSFADYDSDGDPDIYVVNDKFENAIGNVLWRNDGPGCTGWCWTDVSRESGADALLNGMGLAVGDYNNDLDLDFYFTEMVYQMFLLDNQGDGTFDNRAQVARVAVNYNPDHTVGWGTAFFDYDNDGWQDLYMTTTRQGRDDFTFALDIHLPNPNEFFHNNGNGTFSSLDIEDIDRASMGIAYADYDNDGRVDFVIGNWNDQFRLYRNVVNNRNHLVTLKLAGNGPVNRDAIGARALVRTDDGLTQMQEVKSGSGLGAGNDTALHFGLGQANIDSVEIQWPDASVCVLTAVPINRRVVVNYQEPPCSDTLD